MALVWISRGLASKATGKPFIFYPDKVLIRKGDDAHRFDKTDAGLHVMKVRWCAAQERVFTPQLCHNATL